MKISNLTIHQFRSIQHIELTVHDMLVVLGQNNHGKSNVLRAVEYLLTSSVKGVPEDLFSYRQDHDLELWVEAVFSNLTEAERTTFQKYVSADGSIRIRKRTQFPADGKPITSYHGWLEEAEDEFLKGAAVGDLTTRDAINETPLGALVPPTGRITQAHVKDAQARYIADHRDDLRFNYTMETGPLLGQNTVAAGVLPDFYLVPAVRDLSTESKTTSTTLFGKLLGHAIEQMALRDERFQRIRTDLAALVRAFNGDAEEARPAQMTELERSIEDELREWGCRISIEVAPPELEKLFELGTDIKLDDGLKTSAAAKGHGLQRAVLFGLVKAWARIVRTQRNNGGDAGARQASNSVVFAIEEPELFLHPHAQRTLSAALRTLSTDAEHQVLLCSHSTHFVDLDHYRDIAIIRKARLADGSQVRQSLRELFEGVEIDDRKKRFHMASWVNPDRAEMLFARRTVFVEGETEKSVFPYLAQRLGCFSPDVSIIDCGSKHNLPLYIEIAKAFDLDYIVVHDEDPVPDPIPEGWNADKEREKRHTFGLNATIAGSLAGSNGRAVVIRPDFEGFTGISNGQASRKGKALAALDFFDAILTENIAADVSEVIRSLYQFNPVEAAPV
jgi:putative ATP-dependent endonuclease of OLD family